ncbi:MAG: TlpA family protein disulfide reductase [Saprospiraceae bacterium]|nr:TlpA family protein disulfide reductase [Saprospiraceae bacterium]
MDLFKVLLFLFIFFSSNGSQAQHHFNNKLYSFPKSENYNLNIRIEAKHKKLTAQDTFYNTYRFTTEKDSQTLLGLNFIIYDSIRATIQILKKNNFQNLFLIDSTLLHYPDNFVTEKYLNGNSVRLLLYDISNFDLNSKLQNDSTLVSWSLEHNIINHEFIFTHRHCRLDLDSKYENQYVFSDSDFKLKKIKSEVWWKGLTQFDEYKLTELNSSGDFFNDELGRIQSTLSSYKFRYFEDTKSDKQSDSSYLKEGNEILFSDISAIKDVNFTEEDCKNGIILYFWFTNCGPCANTSPIIDSLHRISELNSFKVLTFNTFDTDEKVQRFMTKKDYKFSVYTDYPEFMKHYEIHGYPTIVVIKNNRIKQVYKGYGPGLNFYDGILKDLSIQN